MEGHLLMSREELKRKSVLELVHTGRKTLVKAARDMELSYRQTLRVYARFVAEGDAGLVHRRRGKVSNRAYPRAFRDKVLRRYRERYKELECGPTYAAEKLAEEGLCIDHETLRRWLLEAGEWKKSRKHPAHRSRRERRARFGELVQMDGSHHHWFGREKGMACLMNMVDDATSKTLGLLDHQETTQAAMNALRRWIEKYGIPEALYTDKKNVYVTGREPTFEEQLAGENPLTAFGKACFKLGIEIITAHSPQAKGRVERSNGTYQDRLVKELALRRITTCATADKLLKDEFCDALNEKFAIEPREKEDCHRPLPKGLDLDDIFCYEEHRVVQNDWCIRYKNRYYQILADNKPLPKPKDRVLVRTHLDGRVALLHDGKPLAFRALTPKQLHRQRSQHNNDELRATAPPESRNTAKPAHDHPWRQGYSHMHAETSL